MALDEFDIGMFTVKRDGLYAPSDTTFEKSVTFQGEVYGLDIPPGSHLGPTPPEEYENGSIWIDTTDYSVHVYKSETDEWVSVLSSNGTNPGGNANDVLVKNSNADYDTKWVSQGAGGGLDADKLDGLDGASYAKVGQDTYFRDITASRGDDTGVIYLNGAGNRYLYLSLIHI